MPNVKFKLQSKFLFDAVWNYGAFAAMAATGMFLNLFIAAFYGVEALGIFNQIYVVYIISSQFAVLGFHDSAQKYVSELDMEPEHLGVVSLAALVLAAGFGLLVAFAIYFLADPIGILFESEPVGSGIALAAPGLMFIAINKVLMGVLNGMRMMKHFAGAQALRAVAILLCCVGIMLFEYPPYMLGLGFPIAEIVLLPLLLYFVHPHLTNFSSFEAFKRWVRVHFHFGSRALINGLLIQSYIRIDVIMLGIFVGDHDVGIYTFAAMFVDGLFQIPIIFRTLANPELVRFFKSGEKLATAQFCRSVGAVSLGVFGVVAAIVLFIYPYLGPYFPDDLVNLSYPLLLVLSGGLILYAVMIPVDMIVLQAGMPGRQSLLMTFNVLVNVALNLALIPLYGLYGAAVATAIAFAIASIAINGATWKWLGFKGGVLLYGTPLVREPQ